MAIRFRQLEGFGWDGITVDATGYIFRMQRGPVTEILIRAGESDLAVNINQLIDGAGGNPTPDEEAQWGGFDLPTLTMQEFLDTAIRVDAGDSVLIGAGEMATGDRGIYCVAMASPDGETIAYGGVTKPK